MLDSLWTRRGKASEAVPGGSPPAPPGRHGGPRRRRARKELPEAAELLQALLASRNLLIAIKDRDGRYLEVNDAYARALGLDAQAVRGRLDRDLLAPDVAGEMAQRERLAMRGVALKPGLESFADDAPVYLVERLPILDGRGELAAVCLVGMESPPAVEMGEVVEGRAPVEPRSAFRRAPGIRAGSGEFATLTLRRPGVWLDVSAASNQLEWDAALYRSLLSLFCQRYANFGVRLADAVASGGVGALARDLGRLASGARNLGATPLADLATELAGTVERGRSRSSDGDVARFRGALDATILVIERRIKCTSEPFEWPAAREATESAEGERSQQGLEPGPRALGGLTVDQSATAGASRAGNSIQKVEPAALVSKPIVPP